MVVGTPGQAILVFTESSHVRGSPNVYMGVDKTWAQQTAFCFNDDVRRAIVVITNAFNAITGELVPACAQHSVLYRGENEQLRRLLPLTVLPTSS